MPQFFVQTINSTFVSRDEGADYARPEDAMAVGVRSALEIIKDEVQEGGTSIGVEIRVEQQDGTVVLRSVVAVSVTSVLAVPHRTEQLFAEGDSNGSSPQEDVSG